MSPSQPGSDDTRTVDRRSETSQFVVPDILGAYPKGEIPQVRNAIASLNGDWSFDQLGPMSPEHSGRRLGREGSAMHDTALWADENAVLRPAPFALKRIRESPDNEYPPNKRRHSYVSPQALGTYKSEHNRRFLENYRRQGDGLYKAEHEREERQIGHGNPHPASGVQHSGGRETGFPSYSNRPSPLRNSYNHEDHSRYHGSSNGLFNTNLDHSFGREHSPPQAGFMNHPSQILSPQPRDGQMNSYQPERSSHNSPHPRRLQSPLYRTASPSFRERETSHQPTNLGHYGHDSSPSRGREIMQAPFTPREQRTRSADRNPAFGMELELARRQQNTPHAPEQVYVKCGSGELHDTNGMLGLEAVSSPGLGFLVGRSQIVAPNTPQHQRLLNGDPGPRTPHSQRLPRREDQDEQIFDYDGTPMEIAIRRHRALNQTSSVLGSSYNPRNILPPKPMVFKERVHKTSKHEQLPKVKGHFPKGSGAPECPIDLLSPDNPPPRDFRSTPMKDRLPRPEKPAAPKKMKPSRPPIVSTPTPKVNASPVDPHLNRQLHAAAVIMTRETTAQDKELEETIFGEVLKPSKEEEERAKKEREEFAKRQREEKKRKLEAEEEARQEEESARQLLKEQEDDRQRAMLERERKANAARRRSEQAEQRNVEAQKQEENRARATAKIVANQAEMAAAKQDPKATTLAHMSAIQFDIKHLVNLKVQQEFSKIQAQSLIRSSAVPGEKPSKIHLSPYANDEPLFVNNHDKSLDIYDVDERAKGRLTGPSSAMEVMAAARPNRQSYQDAKEEHDRQRKREVDQALRKNAGEKTKERWATKAAAKAAQEAATQAPRPQKRATGGPSTRKPRLPQKSQTKAQEGFEGEYGDLFDEPESLSPTVPERLPEGSRPTLPRNPDVVHAPFASNVFNKKFSTFRKEKEAEKSAIPQNAAGARPTPVKKPPNQAQKDARRKMEEDKFRVKIYKQLSDLNDQRGTGYTEENLQMMVTGRVLERQANLEKRRAKKNGMVGSNPSLPSAASQPTQSSKHTEENPSETQTSQSQSQPQTTDKPRPNPLSALKGSMIDAVAHPANRASSGNTSRNFTVKDLQKIPSKAAAEAMKRSFDDHGEEYEDEDSDDDSEEDGDDEEMMGRYAAAQKRAAAAAAQKEIETAGEMEDVEGENVTDGDTTSGAENSSEESEKTLADSVSSSGGIGKNGSQESTQDGDDAAEAEPENPTPEPKYQGKIYVANQADTVDGEADADDAKLLGKFDDLSAAMAFAEQKANEYLKTADGPREITANFEDGLHMWGITHDEHRATVFWVEESDEIAVEEDEDEDPAPESKTPESKTPAFAIWLELTTAAVVTENGTNQEDIVNTIFKGGYPEVAMANDAAHKLLVEYIKPISPKYDDVKSYQSVITELGGMIKSTNKTKPCLDMTLDVDEDSVPWMRTQGLKNIRVYVEEQKTENQQA